MTLERVDITDCADPLQVVLHRQRYDFVLARLSPNDDVLEIGVGAGVFSEELFSRSHSYVGVEYDPAACIEARKRTGRRAEIVQGDARDLPFGNEQFSLIVCLEVLEHLGDYESAIRSIHRTLRSDGAAIISVPYRRFGGKSGNEHHLYEPGELELVRCLKHYFASVDRYYQYFEEPWNWQLARVLHIRRFVGLAQIYSDLTTGLPYATSRLHIGKGGKGKKEGLILVTRNKKRWTTHG